MIVVSAPAWPAWGTVTPLLMRGETSTKGMLVRVRLPPLGVAPDAYGGYPDVRVVDQDGREIPFALDPPPTPPLNVRELSVIDTGFVPGSGSQAVVDLGPDAAIVDSVTLGVNAAADPTFFERLAVDASDDRRVWREVRSGAIVYRVAEDGGRGNQTIAFPATRSRWLRIRAFDAHRPFPIESATVARGSTQPEGALEAIPLMPTVAVDAAAHTQTFTFAARRPFRSTAVSVAGATGTFSRTATVSTSDDGVTWSDAGHATIATFADGTSRTSFAYEERTARFVRVSIDDGNDAPLAAVMPTLLARSHEIVFAAAPGSAYAILSGNPAAQTAVYDLRDRLSHGAWRARTAYASAAVANAAYNDPRPIGERAPWLLTAASLGITIVLGAAAIATVRRASPRSDESPADAPASSP